MTKKILLVILMMITFSAKSQLAVGDWKIHSIFGTQIDNVIETPSKVYYLANSMLYAYDKDNGEHDSFNKRNKLNDILISKIFYNKEKDYLFIVYDNSNIDLLFKDGTLVNIPDIKNAILNTSKTINDVNFKGDRVYVATNFGYVIINDAKFEVAESKIYNKVLKSIAAVGDKLLVADESKVYMGDLNGLYPSLSSFQATNITGNVKKIITLSDNSFIYDTGYTYKAVLPETGTTLTLSDVFSLPIINYQANESGKIFQSKTQCKFFDATGNLTTTLSVPSNLQASHITAFKNNNELWIADSNGLKNIKLEGTTQTVLSDYYKPNASTVLNPWNTFFNTVNNKLYVANIGSNQYYASYTDPAQYNTLYGDKWENITPATFPTVNPNGAKNKPQGAYQPQLDPDDASSFVVGTWFEGAYKIKDNQVVAKYDWTNSPMNLNWYCAIIGVQFDKDKNLWLVQSEGGTHTLMVLPRAKQSQTTLTAADWYTPQISGLKLDKKAHFSIIKKNNLKMLTTGNFGSLIYVLDDKGTPETNSDDVYKSFSSFIDQDEKSFEWSYVNCFTEDKNGKVWIGTDNGVVEINPLNVFNSNFRANHLKVPRNDGTPYADYLLESTNVLCIAVDASNRKWIGTQNSGVFLVSEDGSEILENFTMSNSFLTSNQIVSVCCNPTNNSVYIGTPYGIVEYSGSSAPAEDSYDNVYAYPNPVRPDYTGWITIRGLMDNSLVKIADAAGNVFSSGRSTGGMYTWDGCNASGERVKTGVYFVFASQNENGSSSGAVTKILVVN